MKVKYILVTGGGGFLGKAIIKKLLKKNYEVVSFSRKFYPDLEKLGVKQIQGDIADKQAVINAFKNMDSIFHVAAKPGIWGDFKDFYKINVKGTKNVISACFANRVKQLIYTSSPSVVFNEHDMENIDEKAPYADKFLAPYPQTKALAEQLVIKASQKNLNTIIIRPHLIWGPEDNHVVPGIISRAGKLKKIGRKDDLVDTVYVDNAADAHILALHKLIENVSLSGNIYFISQDDPVSKWKMANSFLDAAGLPPIKGHVSQRTAFFAGCICEFCYKLFNIKKDPPITKFAAMEAATSHWFNISKAKKDLGYYPEISTKQGLEILKQWFNSIKR